MLGEAMATRQTLKVHYEGIHGVTERVVGPLYPAAHNGVTKLIADCRLRRDQRTFRVDRISRAAAVVEENRGEALKLAK